MDPVDKTTHTPEIIDRHHLACVACVPEHWPTRQVEAYANRENPASVGGYGWMLEKRIGACHHKAGFNHYLMYA